MTALLDVEHLSMRFGGLLAVDDVSFAAAAAEITALIGPNGAGKTTVFNCLTGFYRPSVGRLALARGSATHYLERMDGFRIARDGGRGAHLPEHPSLRRHDRAGEPDRRPAQHAHAREPLLGGRAPGPADVSPCRGARGRTGAPLARPHRAHRARRRRGRDAALRRAAPARNRARDVHAAASSLSRRAGRRAQPARDRGAHWASCWRSATSTASGFC